MESLTRPYPEYPELLKVDQVCAILGIGRNSVYELIHEGRILSIRIGRNILVPQTAIRRFLNTAA